VNILPANPIVYRIFNLCFFTIQITSPVSLQLVPPLWRLVYVFLPVTPTVHGPYMGISWGYTRCRFWLFTVHLVWTPFGVSESNATHRVESTALMLGARVSYVEACVTAPCPSINKAWVPNVVDHWELGRVAYSWKQRTDSKTLQRAEGKCRDEGYVVLYE